MSHPLHPQPLEPIRLKHPIDPMIDCVFKALFGSEEHKGLLLHFLNSVLQPAVRLEHVELLDPHNNRRALDAKLTIVDIKARASSGEVFHVEVQLALHEAMRERMLYDWAALYERQLGKGEDFRQLRPVISIRVLRRPLFAGGVAHHQFAVRDASGDRLSDHLAIHLLQTSLWTPGGRA